MYKIIKDDKIIDVVRVPRFVRFLSPNNVVITNKSSAQGIAGSDNTTLYSFSHAANKSLDIVTIDKIDEKEFNRLQNLLNSGKEISADENALSAAKQSMIQRLSGMCKNKITSGFSILLSDGEVHNFKLTSEDQLNLMLIENQLTSGENTFIYHETNKPCKVFMREDMLKIVRAFKHHVLYHTTYFNAVKQYIKSLTNIEQVNLFTYGTDVSEYVEDVVIRQILKNGGSL